MNAVTDPDSLKWERSLASDSGNVICLQFRSRNALGGMVRTYVTYDGGQVSQDVKRWNVACTKPMHDMMWITHFINERR